MPENKREKALKAIMEIVNPSLKKLREIERKPDDVEILVPSDEFASKCINGCLHSRNGTWRRSKPDDDESALLWQLVKFHRGNGSLWGYPWFSDETKTKELDTLAIVLLGNQSNAADAWKKAIYG